MRHLRDNTGTSQRGGGLVKNVGVYMLGCKSTDIWYHW